MVLLLVDVHVVVVHVIDVTSLSHCCVVVPVVVWCQLTWQLRCLWAVVVSVVVVGWDMWWIELKKKKCNPTKQTNVLPT